MKRVRIKSFSPSRRFLKFYATILPGEGLRTPPKRSDSFADLLIYWSSPVRRPKFLSSYHRRHWYHDSAKNISSLSALRVFNSLLLKFVFLRVGILHRVLFDALISL